MKSGVRFLRSIQVCEGLIEIIFELGIYDVEVLLNTMEPRAHASKDSHGLEQRHRQEVSNVELGHSGKTTIFPKKGEKKNFSFDESQAADHDVTAGGLPSHYCHPQIQTNLLALDENGNKVEVVVVVVFFSPDAKHFLPSATNPPTYTPQPAPTCEVRRALS
ncbi:hypothetical protein ACLOJK_000753 [Asimina triloba]